ncbi:YigZ family protein [Enterococcus lemanii]|uniref:YigZ family protein n=1 Tax=Enterococcus lemanii TaxID=1159752 RepID=A0ABV9N0N2_9ENTE|nr:YigZ family protein [Enterococcus lemanii]MBM7710334.1 putative YigZ family protein [Enterococcus lemanii]
MLEKYRTIRTDGQVEIEIKKSRFICFAKRVSSEEEAREYIQAIKKEHWKANHNCSAYILGKKAEVLRSSDDGEPSGTAGVPMLEVLKNNQLVDVVVVVTRYFGGVKLGAGGLIRAYSSAVSTMLEEIGIVEATPQQEIFATVDYSLSGKLQHFLETNDYTIKETLFLENVTFCVLVKDAVSFEEQLIDLLHGNVELKEGNYGYVEQLVTRE